MAYDSSQLPSTITVTNNDAANPVDLAGFYSIPAGATNLVIDLTLFSAAPLLGKFNIRRQVWQALVETARITTPRGTPVLTIVSTSPNVLPLTATAYDNKYPTADAVLAPRSGMPGYQGPRIVDASRVANDYVLLTFDQPVYHVGGTAVVAGDLSIAFAVNGGSASNVTIASVQTAAGGALAGGEKVIRVNLTVTGSPTGVGVLTVVPGATLVTSAGVSVDPGSAVSYSLITALRLSGASISATNVITLTFPSPIYHTGGTAPVAGDFTCNFTKNAGLGGTATGASIASVTKVPTGALAGGETSIIVNLTITGTVHGEETVNIQLTTGLNSLGVVADAANKTAELPLHV